MTTAMHKTQQIIVLIGILVISLMVLYPPWVYVDHHQTQHPMGYAPIWKPPIERQHDTAELFGIKLQLDLQTHSANTIDLFRLLVQIAGVCAVAGGATVLLRRASV
jgi:hypothetical protein